MLCVLTEFPPIFSNLFEAKCVKKSSKLATVGMVGNVYFRPVKGDFFP